MNKKRVLAVVISVLLVASLVLSFDFLLAEGNHRCTGKSCPVCHQLGACIQALTGGAHAGGTEAAAFLCAAASLLLRFFFLRIAKDVTLVSLKVKLSS